MNKKEQLADEIRQMVEQYRREVAPKRGAWPKSIKQKVCELKELGLSGRDLSNLTGVSQASISTWTRPKRLNQIEAAATFIPISINSTEKSSTEKSLHLKSYQESCAPRFDVELPGGIRALGIDIDTLVQLSRRLTQ